MNMRTSPVVGRGREYFARRYDPRYGIYLSLNRSAQVRHHHATAAAALRSALDGAPPGRVLDVGCAAADFTASLQREFPAAAVLGMDFVPDGLREARRRYPAIALLQAALPVIPLRPQSVDLVCCMEMLCYLDGPGLQAAVAEIDRVLAPEGVVLVSTNLDRGQTYFSEAQVRELFAPRFELLSTAYEHCRLYRLLSLPSRKSRQLLLRARWLGAPGRAAAALVGRTEESMALARAGIWLGRVLLGSRAVTNGTFVFRRRRPAGSGSATAPVAGRAAGEVLS